MQRVTKILKSRPNNDYTGIIHMARYINTTDRRDTGIIFLEQTFEDMQNVRKGSFYGDEYTDTVYLIEEEIEEEFGVKIDFMYGQGELLTSIEVDGTCYFLYDDTLGNYKGENISFDEAQISDRAINKMFSRLAAAKKIVCSSTYKEENESLEELSRQINNLKGITDSLEKQYTLIKKNRRNTFEKMMNKK